MGVGYYYPFDFYFFSHPLFCHNGSWVLLLPSVPTMLWVVEICTTPVSISLFFFFFFLVEVFYLQKAFISHYILITESEEILPHIPLEDSIPNWNWKGIASYKVQPTHYFEHQALRINIKNLKWGTFHVFNPLSFNDFLFSHLWKVSKRYL